MAWPHCTPGYSGMLARTQVAEPRVREIAATERKTRHMNICELHFLPEDVAT